LNSILLSAGIELIKEFEDCILTAYPDPHTGNLPITIGWGSTRDFDGKPFKLGQKITQQYADDLFLHQIEKEYLPPLKKIPYWSEMNEYQQGAILSFAYNLGADFYGSSNFNTITRILKNREWDKVPETLKLYRNPGTDVEAGLLRRRIAEGKLWLS
jgi:lysozyme